MTDLAAWLLDRIAEDEAAARAATSPQWWPNPRPSYVGLWAASEPKGRGRSVGQVKAAADAEHIARHDPARVLAECAAKRRIVQEVSFMKLDTLTMGWVLQQLAVPYADHPDYDPSWMPFT
jgi:hypothetical protein